MGSDNLCHIFFSIKICRMPTATRLGEQEHRGCTCSWACGAGAFCAHTNGLAKPRESGGVAPRAETHRRRDQRRPTRRGTPRKTSLAHVCASCGTLSGAIVHASASRVVSGDKHELALLLIHRQPPRPMHYEQEKGAHRRDGLEEEVSLMVRHCERVHFETFHIRDALHLEGSISAQIPATAQRVRLVEL